MEATNKYLVQASGREYDRDILSNRSLPVNIRLFEINETYKSIVKSISDYLLNILEFQWKDYGTTVESSISAPVVGIPFNIIAFKGNGQQKTLMINPFIKEKSEKTIVVKSNCSSFKLKERIDILRYEWIRVSYYDINGELFCTDKLYKNDGGMAVQHEIDHLNGITIIDKFLANGGNLEIVEKLLPERF